MDYVGSNNRAAYSGKRGRKGVEESVERISHTESTCWSSILGRTGQRDLAHLVFACTPGSLMSSWIRSRAASFFGISHMGAEV